MNTTEGPNQGSLAVKHRKLCKYKKLSISLQVWFFLNEDIQILILPLKTPLSASL